MILSRGDTRQTSLPGAPVWAPGNTSPCPPCGGKGERGPVTEWTGGVPRPPGWELHA